MAKTLEVSKVKNIGLELTDKSIELEDGNLVGNAVVKHVGQSGFITLSITGSFALRPLIYKAIDWAEEKIPGDQTMFASVIKAAIDNIKL